MRRYVLLILRIRRAVLHVTNSFIHTMNYLNIQGHVESIYVFNVMFHFYLQRHWIIILYQDIGMQKLKRNPTNVQYVKKKCENRKELYSHRLNQHGGNDNNQDIPPFICDHPNDELIQVYNTNRKYIFPEDETGELKKIYNFTTNDLHGGYREIRGHLS